MIFFKLLFFRKFFLYKIRFFCKKVEKNRDLVKRLQLKRISFAKRIKRYPFFAENIKIVMHFLYSLYVKMIFS